jgi:hypothetical protein
VKKGFFRTELDEILLYRILDVKSTQTLWQKIFGVGTLTLFSADQSNPQLILKNIKKPEKLHRYLSDVIEKNRQSKGVVGREIVGSAGMRQGPGHDGDAPGDFHQDAPDHVCDSCDQ